MRNQDPKVTMAQIGRNTLMCVGARQFAFDSAKQALIFKTTISQNVNNHFRITVNAGDLYDIELLQTRMGVTKVTQRATDIGCEDINECVYRMGSPKGQGPEWFARYGIKNVNEVQQRAA